MTIVRRPDGSIPEPEKPVPAPLPAYMSAGEICSFCGGLMIRTGSCHTCTQCGNNTGCG
jgi:ribonucleoside-diphosphate reductase alpha chain